MANVLLVTLLSSQYFINNNLGKVKVFSWVLGHHPKSGYQFTLWPQRPSKPTCFGAAIATSLSLPAPTPSSQDQSDCFHHPPPLSTPSTPPTLTPHGYCLKSTQASCLSSEESHMNSLMILAQLDLRKTKSSDSLYWKQFCTWSLLTNTIVPLVMHININLAQQLNRTAALAGTLLSFP